MAFRGDAGVAHARREVDQGGASGRIATHAWRLLRLGQAASARRSRPLCWRKPCYGERPLDARGVRAFSMRGMPLVGVQYKRRASTRPPAARRRPRSAAAQRSSCARPRGRGYSGGCGASGNGRAAGRAAARLTSPALGRRLCGLAPAASTLSSIAFADATHGSAAAGGSGDPRQPSYLATTDGGATWERADAARTALATSTPSPSPTASDGWAVGSTPRPAMASSWPRTNGGATWSAADVVHRRQRRALSVRQLRRRQRTAGRWAGTRTAGVILATTDGGTTWSRARCRQRHGNRHDALLPSPSPTPTTAGRWVAQAPTSPSSSPPATAAPPGAPKK